MVKKRNWLAAALTAAILLNVTSAVVMAEDMEANLRNDYVEIKKEVQVHDAVEAAEVDSSMLYADNKIKASGTYGNNLTWKLEDGTLTIFGNGEMEGEGYERYPWEDYNEIVRRIVIEEGVTSIEEAAFEDFRDLIGVSIAESVNSIGAMAFENCDALTDVTLPNGITAIEEGTFCDCKSLNHIVFPESLETIGFFAFGECQSLKEINLPSSLKEVESEAFWGCVSLELVDYGGSNEEWNAIKIDDIRLPYIRNGSVSGKLISENGNKEFSWILENGNLSISGTGEMPFYTTLNDLYDKIVKITINEGVSSICSNEFRDFTNVVEIDLPLSLSIIEECAFSGCYAISSVNYAGTDEEWNKVTVEPFGNSYLLFAMSGREASGVCGDNLVWSLQDDTLTISGSGAMYDYDTKEDGAPWGCYSQVIKTAVIGDGVETIGEAAFFHCENLANVKISDTVSLIGISAFGGCDSLETIVIPEGVKVIDRWAFEECHKLSDVSIPISIDSIRKAAFKNCFSLKSVAYGGSDRDWKAIDIEEQNEYMRYTKEGMLSGVCGDNLKWTVQDGILTISGSGDMYDYNDYGKEGLDIPASPWIQLAYAEVIKEVIINNGVSGIGSGAFARCDQVRIVDIPEGVTYIGEGAFSDTTKLTEVIIPKTVKTIGENAFEYKRKCDLIIRFSGSASEWKDIQIGEYNDSLTKATIYYNYTNKIPNERLINAFISQLYTNFLAREADSSGLEAWSDALVDGKTTGAKVVYKFVYSDEFQANPLSDKDFVTAMYETVFSREPDNSGLNAWVKVLENGCTRKKVLAGFLNSDEMEELCDDMGIEVGSYHSDEIVDKNTKVTYFVSRMYRCCLGRDADFGGLTSWVSALLDGRATGTKIADGFFFSDEMKNMGLSNRDYVTNAYVALLDRQPDVNGLNAWTDALDKGADRKKIVKGFVGSQEFGNLCAEYGITR